MRSFIFYVAVVLCCAGSTTSRSLTDSSASAWSSTATSGGSGSSYSSTSIESGSGVSKSSNATDTTVTTTKEIGPGATETTTTTIKADGTKIVKTTRTYTSSSISDSKKSAKKRRRRRQRRTGFGDPSEAYSNLLDFLMKRAGFGFEEDGKDKKRTPENQHPMADEIPSEDVDDLDVADQSVVPTPEYEEDDCSDVETSAEAVERCVNAVRQNPAKYSPMLHCQIPEYTPRHPLKTHPLLTSSAAAHAFDMASSKYVAHEGSNGSTMGDRIWSTAGFRGSPIAENVAGGQQSAWKVVSAWMCSPGHRRNIMSCAYDSMGTGVVINGRIYWVQNFGCTKYNECKC